MPPEAPVTTATRSWDVGMVLLMEIPTSDGVRLRVPMWTLSPY
jgi:hypothetical protein